MPSLPGSPPAGGPDEAGPRGDQSTFIPLKYFFIPPEMPFLILRMQAVCRGCNFTSVIVYFTMKEETNEEHLIYIFTAHRGEVCPGDT